VNRIGDLQARTASSVVQRGRVELGIAPEARQHRRLVNVHQAKTHLSQLLQEVEQGQEVVIARSGVPIARLVAWQAPARAVAAPGAMRGCRRRWWNGCRRRRRRCS
jgi:antitoxin (DNA-binding transcriptional repressor) of toxin-antitoxin stability system